MPPAPSLCNLFDGRAVMTVFTYEQACASLEAVMDRVVEDHLPALITRQR
jgi:hypothetical protein